MKITILTQYYPPEHGAPQNRLHDIAVRCLKAGHDVTVLTAMPNYPKGEVFPEYRGKLFFKENIDGINVVRSWIFSSNKKSVLTQLAVYFSFVFSSIIAGIFYLKKSDILLCESPPLFLGASAFLISKLKGARMIMNISDLWPESAVQLGIIGEGITLKILERFERFLYHQSILVTCQTKGIESGVKKSCPQADTLLFPNGVDLTLFPVHRFNLELASSLGIPDNAFIVGYGGNHGRSQALKQVIDAADIIRKEQNYKDILFILFGDGPEKKELMEYTGEKGIDNVKFFPSQPREKMAEIQGLWDIALVPLKNIDLFTGARPSKMFELMAGEKPFVFCGKGEGADIALKSGCAAVTPPENPDKLAEKIIEFYNMPEDTLRSMGKKGREFVSRNFNREILAQQLIDKISEIIRIRTERSNK